MFQRRRENNIQIKESIFVSPQTCEYSCAVTPLALKLISKMWYDNKVLVIGAYIAEVIHIWWTLRR
jgi:hypothetical protein